MVKNDTPVAVGLSHGVVANNPDNENDLTSEEEDYPSEPSTEEIVRWNTLYEEVFQKNNQKKWVEIPKMLWTENFTSSMRGHIIQHLDPKVRIRKYLSLILKKRQAMLR